MTDEQEFLAAADEHGVGHAGKSLWYWIERGCTPGGFLTAVLCNDLTKAVSRADDRNVELIPNYVRLLYNHAPMDCWGSERAISGWIDTLRLEDRKPRKWRVGITKVVREHYDAQATFEAPTEAEARAVASTLTDFEVDFPEKDADVDVEYFVHSVTEVAA